MAEAEEEKSSAVSTSEIMTATPAAEETTFLVPFALMKDAAASYTFLKKSFKSYLSDTNVLRAAEIIDIPRSAAAGIPVSVYAILR